MYQTQNINSLDWNALILEPIQQNTQKLFVFLPNIINAIFIFVFGWIIAFIAKIVFIKLFKYINFNNISEKTGVTGALNENGISVNPTEWASRLLFWIILISAIVKALFELQLGSIAYGLDLITGFVFQTLGLLAIFIIGIFMSIVFSKIIQVTSTNLNIKSPAVYSRIMKWAVLTFTFLLIVRQITIPINFVLIAVGAVFASLCIAFVIAFGFGGTGWAGKMLDKISK